MCLAASRKNVDPGVLVEINGVENISRGAQDINEPGIVLLTEKPADHPGSHVGIDQQNLVAGVGGRTRKAYRQSRLSLPGKGGGDLNDPQGSIRARIQVKVES